MEIAKQSPFKHGLGRWLKNILQKLFKTSTNVICYSGFVFGVVLDGIAWSSSLQTINFQVINGIHVILVTKVVVGIEVGSYLRVKEEKKWRPCEYCNDLFTSRHHLKHKRFKLLVMDEEARKPIHHAKIITQEMKLVDYGDPYHFFDMELAKKLRYKMEFVISMTPSKRRGTRLKVPYSSRAFTGNCKNLKILDMWWCYL